MTRLALRTLLTFQITLRLNFKIVSFLCAFELFVGDCECEYIYILVNYYLCAIFIHTKKKKEIVIVVNLFWMSSE